MLTSWVLNFPPVSSCLCWRGGEDPPAQSRSQRPRYPTAGLVKQIDVTEKRPGCSNWRRAVLNFGPLWRGISVGSDLKPRSLTQLSVICLLVISKTTLFLEWPSPLRFQNMPSLTKFHVIFSSVLTDVTFLRLGILSWDLKVLPYIPGQSELLLKTGYSLCNNNNNNNNNTFIEQIVIAISLSRL